GDAKAIEFSEEEPRRIQLIFAGEFWSLGEGGIENVGVWFGGEKSRGIPVAIPLNLAVRQIRRILVVDARTRSRSVEYTAIIRMHYEHWSIRRHCVDLLERRHAAFGKLKFRPAPDHPDPLWRGSSRSLIL